MNAIVWALGIGSVALTWTLLFSQAVVQGLCGCSPPQLFEAPQTVRYRFASDIDGSRRTALQGHAATATNRWNAAFSNAGDYIDIAPGGSGDDLLIRLSVIPVSDMEYDVDANEIRINEDFYNSASFLTHLEKFMVHEFGHAVGLGDVASSGCSNQTVMFNVMATLGTSTPTTCDSQAITEYFSFIDNDVDTYAANEFPLDCVDSDPSIHPYAALPTCSQLWFNGELEGDRNCNHTADGLECDSPIILNLDGRGIQLTSRANGVLFDLDGDGSKERLPWTVPGSRDGWLVLDRNGNGSIDSGLELFSNFAEQPLSTHPNGFMALSVLDSPEAGGDGDGRVDTEDALFDQLFLWADSNHDGVSRPRELTSLHDEGVRGISLDFKWSNRIDRWGNMFRYRARVFRANPDTVGPFAWDVFFAPPEP